MSQEKEIEKTFEIIQMLIDKFVSEPRKTELEKFFSSDLGVLYMTAPASSKKEYHYAFPGGLALHSINVYKNLRKLREAFADTLGKGITDEQILICSLFHDVGKSCNTDLNEPHYVPNQEEWALKKGIMYQYNKDGVYMTTHLRSIFVLQRIGFQLSAEEFQAIYLNDGMYLQENRSYGLHETPLALLLHMADRIACSEEQKDKN